MGSRSGKRNCTKVCQSCGKIMVGVGNNRKWCTDCGEEINRERAAERLEKLRQRGEEERKEGRELCRVTEDAFFAEWTREEITAAAKARAAESSAKIKEIVQAAEAVGLSYGQYVAALRSKK